MRWLLVLVAACAPFRSPAESPDNGALIADYRFLSFDGGAMHVVLIQNDEVAEWVTNEYRVPVTIDVARATANLAPVVPLPPTIMIPPGKNVLIGLWRVDDSNLRWREDSRFAARLGAPGAQPAPYAYGLPFPAGETHTLIQGFDGAFSHQGDSEYAIDFEMPEGTIVRAARDGVVVASNDGATGHGTTPEWKDMARANWVFVQHDDGTLGAYWHLAPGGVTAAIGQRVLRGDPIARSGFTGYAAVPHLHFEVMSAMSGAHARSFPFRLHVENADEAPVAGKAYSAFE
ncbi:MAG TPA: M23 family metallopeptidase [Kofleriaceae bacterium]|nr:M23 family metallopeptidase [Kofleriaceae bacterium]